MAQAAPTLRNVSEIARKAKSYSRIALAVGLLWAIGFGTLLEAQTRVSVGFEDGFVGEFLNQAHAPKQAKTFASLGVQAAVISQESDNGQFGGSQGNDYVVDVTFLFSDGSYSTFKGAVNWRDTDGSNIYAVGLIGVDDLGDPLANPADGTDYVLSSGYSKSYALKLVGSPRVYQDTAVGVAEPNVKGNAATAGLLDALNDYLASVSTVASTIPSALTTTVTASETQIDSDGVTTTLITVQLRDVNGNAITSGGFPVTLTTDKGTLLDSLQDNGDGTYTQYLQSSTTVETATLSATLDADGDGPNAPATLTSTATVDFVSPLGSAITGTKTVELTDNDTSGGLSAGDTLTYTITATNTGATTLTDVAVQSDSLEQGDGTAPANAFDETDFTTSDPTTLAPGESVVFTAQYSVTQADVDAGGLVNSATVSGTDPDSTVVTDTTDNGDDTDGNTADDATSLTVTASPGLELVLKEDSAPSGVTEPMVSGTNIVDMDGDGKVSVGDRIYYLYEISNTGNVTVSGISVSDPDASISGSSFTLAPGETDTSSYSGYRTITQDDMDAGEISQTATATGSSPTGTDDVSDQSDYSGAGSEPTVTALPSAPGVRLIKTATLVDADSVLGVSAGDRIDYVFELANAGDLGLLAPLITEDSFSGSGEIGALTLEGGDIDTDSVLDVGETWVFVASYTITAADIAGDGVIYNAATASATPASGGDDVTAQSRPSAEAEASSTVIFLGSITGVVSEGGEPVPGVQVVLVARGSNEEIMATTSGEDGSYVFLNIPAGEYAVEFRPTGGSGYGGQDNTDQGLTESVNKVSGIVFSYPSAASARILSGVDAIALDPSGVIYDAYTREPISGATVTLLYEDAPVDGSWLVGGNSSVVTGAGGDFSFLLQSPAQSGLYTIEVTYGDYAVSAFIPPQSDSYTPDFGGMTEEIVASATAPQAGEDTTYYVGFNFTFGNWSAPETLSNGVVHNHIALDAPREAIIPRIEEDLKDILEADLRATMRGQMQRFSNLSVAARDRLRFGERLDYPCGDEGGFNPNGALLADGNGVNLDLADQETVYDCNQDLWIQREWELSYHLDSDLGHQLQLSFTEMRERFISEDELRGWFWGGYLSDTTVDRASSAAGRITGIGANLGFYGADRLKDDLYTDFYGAIAAGYHQFDLEFQPDWPVNVQGDYSYLAIYFGAGLSGDTRLENDWLMVPEVRFDFAHAFAGDAHVVAKYIALDEVGESGVIPLDDQSALRLTGEVSFSNRPDLTENTADILTQGRGFVTFAPRAFYDLDIGRGFGSFGFGGYLAYEEPADIENESFETRLDFEQRNGGDFSVSAQLTHRLWFDREQGLWEQGVSVSPSGSVTLSSELNWKF